MRHLQSSIFHLQSSIFNLQSSIGLILLCLLPLTSRAQLLYEVSGNNAQAKSYILATNRITDMAILDSIQGIWKAWSHCSRVVTEFAMEDYEALAVLRQSAVLPDSVRLSDYYSTDEYQRIDETLTLQLGMGLDQLCRMKPANLTEMLRNELFRRWLDYDEQRSMETFFQEVALQREMPVFGLDNIGETMYMLFDREPFEYQCRELLMCIDYPEREVRQQRELQAMFREGRLNDMIWLVTAPDNQTTISYSDYQVYASRNITWVKRLTPYLLQGKTFVTLDALYLGGDRGLLQQLRAAGFRVRPAKI